MDNFLKSMTAKKIGVQAGANGATLYGVGGGTGSSPGTPITKPSIEGYTGSWQPHYNHPGATTGLAYPVYNVNGVQSTWNPQTNAWEAWGKPGGSSGNSAGASPSSSSTNSPFYGFNYGQNHQANSVNTPATGAQPENMNAWLAQLMKLLQGGRY